VLLVGHEPHLGELTSLLVAGQAGCGFTFKKGGLARLTTEALKAGRCATLEWLLTPRQMLRMV
jgi:phosphohistidine phosphatase SixA